jgi:glycosyltransferase involved in cell wall biosynthesis
VAWRLLLAWGRVNLELRRARYEAVIITSDVDLWPMALLVLFTLATRGATRVTGICHSVRPLNRWAGEDLFAESSLLSRLLARMYAQMDILFVHGESSRSEFEATWPSGRLIVIPHGDERIFSGEPPAPSEQKRALFFGEWRKVKGLDVLMEAFEKLLSKNSEVLLTIAGTPCPVDLDPRIVHDWAARQGSAVEVIDRYVPVDEVARLFGSARAVVTPYLVAYQSGVVHLAMTMERAVVASEVGDLVSVVIDGQTGLTVSPGDSDALAAALERVLLDGDLAKSLGREGRRRLLAGSSWELVAERIEGALSDCV